MRYNKHGLPVLDVRSVRQQQNYRRNRRFTVKPLGKSDKPILIKQSQSKIAVKSKAKKVPASPALRHSEQQINNSLALQLEQVIDINRGNGDGKIKIKRKA